MTTLTAVAALVFGVIGTVLGIWGRVDRIRDDREKRRGMLPSIMATLGEPRSDGWRYLSVMINPQKAKPFDVLAIRSGEDIKFTTSTLRENRWAYRGDRIANPPDAPDESASTSVISCSDGRGWHVSSRSLRIVRWMKSSSAPTVSASELEILARCRFASDSRDEFTIRTTARASMPTD